MCKAKYNEAVRVRRCKRCGCTPNIEYKHNSGVTTLTCVCGDKSTGFWSTAMNNWQYRNKGMPYATVEVNIFSDSNSTSKVRGFISKFKKLFGGK